ncbi:MAG TPA: mannose-1-phosphate guanylyltransferase [Balneolaceae bacterium]|nr:mannose-1-phosphate guanylyltransferase [Balneolaceae bacterium]
MLHAVIMAGGAGTRFWPESTKKTPKQFLSLFGDGTMLQTTVRRIEALVPADRVWIITNERYVDLVREQLPDISGENIIGEPLAKDTAPCVAAAAALIQRRDADATMAVLPADHLISDNTTFLSILQAAAEKARQSEGLVTIGIKPTRPETGYGYIEFDKDSEETIAGHTVRKVVQFREKPDITTARQFIYAGRFLWNSGMFVWQVDAILKEFEKHLPKVAEAVAGLRAAGNDGQQDALKTYYQACPSISIDYGIMEQAEKVFVLPGSFGWSDVGSWKALYELSNKDERGNVLQNSNTVTENVSNSLVHGTSNKMIALVGVENLAVVETKDAILVCNLDQAQGVKQVVKKLENSEETKKFL